MPSPKPHPPKLYNYVAKFRYETRLSQTTLAERVGITRGGMHKIENKESVPSILTALLLAKHLQVNVEDLFSLEEVPVLTAKEKFDLKMAELDRQIAAEDPENDDEN